MKELKVGDKFNTNMQFNCPFCDGQAVVGEEAMAVIHSLPPCDQWIRLDALDYLHAVNEKIVEGGPEAVLRACVVGDLIAN